MKVAQVSAYDFAYPGGVTNHIWHLSHHLIRRGHEVKIIAPCSRKVSFPDIEIIPLGQPVIQWPVAGSIARVGTSSTLARPIRRVLDRERFDILHIHEAMTPALPIEMIRYSTDETKIGTFHAFRNGSWGYTLFKPLLRHWFRRLDACTAVSKPARDFVSRYFPADYQIIPNGIDLTRFNAEVEPIPWLDDGRRNILFVGRPEKRKGLKHLFGAYRKLKKEFPDARLIVVGPGTHMRRHYERVAQEYGLEDVVFTGYVSNEELPRYYKSADVFCTPATGQESFGIILIEAMAMGKPVVASSIEGYATVIEHGVQGLLVPPRDEMALAQALTTILDNPDLRLKMGAQGRLKAAEYGWERIAEQVEELYLKLHHGTRDAPSPTEKVTAPAPP